MEKYKCIKTIECGFGMFQAGKSYEYEICADTNVIYMRFYPEDMIDYNKKSQLKHPLTNQKTKLYDIAPGYKFSIKKNYQYAITSNDRYKYLYDYFSDVIRERKLKIQKLNEM
jgi:hypothetical protein